MHAIGYVRVSADADDLATERDRLAALGVPGDRVFVDYGLTGAGRDRPGLRGALAACRPGDTLVVTKLHRLASSIADAREIAGQLGSRGVRLNLDGLVLDPGDAASRIAYKALVMLADFESDLARSRTREGLKAARAKGRLRGKPPKLDAGEQARLVRLHQSEEYSPEELAELFGVARATVYRVLERARRGAIASAPDGHRVTSSSAGPAARD